MRQLPGIWALVLAGCGGVAAESISDGVDGGNRGSAAAGFISNGVDGGTDGGAAVRTISGGVDGASDGANGVRAPANHRSEGSTCTLAPQPPEPTILDAGLGPSATFECQKHADCTAKPSGRCIFVPTSPPVDLGGTRCIYDECTTDVACAPGAICECGNVANVCVQGTCRLDSDCGKSGYCSPGTDDCGNPNGFYCHTAADSCVDDTDCAGGPVRCVPDSTTHVWSCKPVGCQ